MNLFRKILLGALVVLALPSAAGAACGSLPYTFINGVSIVDATTINGNNNFLLGCVTNVDASQIGTAGIYPSQLVPISIGTATFGGSYGYRFSLAAPSQPVLSIFGATSQTGDLFDIWSVGGATKYYSVDPTGNIRLPVGNQSLNGGTSQYIQLTDSSATPNKYLRATSGSFTIYNSAFNTDIFDVSDAGLANIVGGVVLPINSATNAGTNSMSIGVDGAGYGTFRIQSPNGAQFQNNNASGYAPVRGGVYTNASDRRFKRHIHASPYGLAAIAALRPAAYTSNDKPELGFVAQDVAAVLPELVTADERGYLGVNYSGIIPVLARAIQEQQEQIDELKRQLAKRR